MSLYDSLESKPYTPFEAYVSHKKRTWASFVCRLSSADDSFYLRKTFIPSNHRMLKQLINFFKKLHVSGKMSIKDFCK